MRTFFVAGICGLSLLMSGCGESSSESASETNPESVDDLAAASAEASEGTGMSDAESEEDPPAEEFGPAPEGKVLRHAVFFGFRDSTSEEQIQEVVDAFRGLPEKIDAITDFAWGTNNSPEKLDDGFTHCFLLTFKDEAGRAEYLPHPAHKEFGKVLSGRNDQTFVFDYWGTPAEELPEKQLLHAVFFRFKEDAPEEGIRKVEEEFAALPSKIPEIKAFEWGTNNSPETKDDGFTHCFLVTFASEEDRQVYLDHPDHVAFVEVLKPVLDAPRVLDFWAQQ